MKTRLQHMSQAGGSSSTGSQSLLLSFGLLFKEVILKKKKSLAVLLDTTELCYSFWK